MNFELLKRKRVRLLKQSVQKFSSNKKILPQTASSNESCSIKRKVFSNLEDVGSGKFMPVENKLMSNSLKKIKAPLKCF